MPKIAIIGVLDRVQQIRAGRRPRRISSRAPISKATTSSPRRAAPTPTMLPETPGFVAAMDAAGPWQPVGIALAMAEPNGPVEHGFFAELLRHDPQRG